MNGKLYLIPTPLGEMSDIAALPYVLPLEVMQQSAKLSYWVAENAKTARAFLKSLNTFATLAQPIQALNIYELPKHSVLNTKASEGLLQPCLQGHDMGLCSEAGVPAVADPGALIVAAAHRLGLTVIPCVGPSSLLLALMASGLNGQCFAFHGYLPREARERNEMIKTLEARGKKLHETQLVIETPYRNAALFQALIGTLSGETNLCIAQGLSTPHQFIRTLTVKQWKSTLDFAIKDSPTVFCWL